MSLLFPVHFLAGVAVGSIVTWQLDRRRQRPWMQQLNTQLLSTPAKSGQSETQHGTGVGYAPDAVDTAGYGLSAAASILAASTSEPHPVPPEPGHWAVDAPIAQDQPEQITGIEPVCAPQLNGAGSRTFPEVATLTPEEIAEPVTPDNSAKKR